MKKFSFLVAIIFCLNAGVQAQINSNTFGMLEARHLGPGTMSGRITSIEGVNNDPKTLYIGTAGGGVWKTVNAGSVFKSIFDKYCQSIGAIAIDQKNPKVIYVGTGESNMRNSVSIGDGIYKSTDAGDNWNKIGLDSTEHISKIIIDHSNPNIIYVSVPGPLWSSSKHRGLYRSIDAGKTFEKIFYINENTGCADISMDPRNAQTLYATTWEFRRLPYSFNSGGAGSGIYKSVDAGKTWKELSKGLPAKPFGRVALTLAPSSPDNMLAIVESNKTGLYISADGGENWKEQSASMNVVSRPFYFSTLVIDPKDPKRVYRPALNFSYSSDGGYSFTDAGSEGGWVHSDHHALWINPNNTDQMYLGTDGGVYMSMNKGVNWTFFQNLPVGQFYHVQTDLKTPYNVFGGLQDNGSWVAPSQSYGGVSNGNWRDIFFGDGFWTQPDLNDPNTVYAESQGGNAARINLKTGLSVKIQPQQGATEDKLRWNWNTPIVLGIKNNKNLYMGAQYLYKSTDQGRNWLRISPDLTTNDKKKQNQEKSGGLSADNTSAENHCTIFTIAESPLDENLIWVGTDDGNLQYSMDGGKNWVNVSNNIAASGIPSQTWVSSIEPSRFDKNVVYASFDNHMYGDHKTYLGKSIDMGKTWTLIKSDEFIGFAHKIKEDLINKDLLFLGTEMGLFASLDGGTSWFRMKNNIPWYALVRDIQIHPKTHDLVLGTHGRGIIIIDDISPMRFMTRDISEKDVHFFQPEPMKLTQGNYADGGSPSTGGLVAPNAATIPPFQYYLKDRVSSGEVKIDILDKDGKLVQSIPASKRKGINRVYWNQRIIPPKVAQGTSPDYSGFVAPQVLPGDYTIRLTVGKNVYNTKLTAYHDDDDDKSYTLAERMLNYKTALQLHGMHEELAKEVEAIADRQKILKQASEKTKNNKTKVMLEEYYSKLEEIKSIMVPTEKRSIFAEIKRLREDISDVYISISSQEAPPSNLQLERVRLLDNKVKAAGRDVKTVVAKYGLKAETAIKKEGLISDPGANKAF